MKKTLLSIIILLATNIVAAQEIEQEEAIDSLDTRSIKRISAGIKIGVPNIAGISLEGVTPLLDNRVAPYFDYSSFNVNPEDVEVGLTYSEFGTNIYFGNKGKGAYAGIGFGNLKTDLIFNDVSFEEDGETGTGKGSINTNVNTTNVKLGIKTGGRIYFRLEIGYGIGDIPVSVDVTGTFESNGQTRTGTTTEDFPTIPGVGENGILVGNFGFGFSF